MGRNKELRKRIESLAGRIASHRLKIALELQRIHPDVGLIAHWRREVAAWETTVKNLERRLKKEKRHVEEPDLHN